MGIGILCLGYFVLYTASTGLTNIFTYFWLIAGILSIFGALLPGILQKHNITIPKPVKWSLGVVAFLGIAVVVVAEGFIISYGNSTPDAGADYVIVLGAQAMATYLENKGLALERMIMEAQSKNTDENIEYSRQLMKSQDMSVIIVTNDFHVFRGVRIAKKQGLENVQGLGASTHWYTVPNLYLREVFAVVKYFLCGQI